MRKTRGMPTAVTTERAAHRLSVEQAAPLLGVSVYLVRSLVRQRRLAYYRVGRRIVLDRDDLEQFLKAHRVEPRALSSDPPRGTSMTRPPAGTKAPRPGASGGGSAREAGG